MTEKTVKAKTKSKPKAAKKTQGAKATKTKSKPKAAKKTQGAKATKTKSKPKAAKKTRAKPKEESIDDIGIVIVDDDITIDKEKVNEERRAYLEEARSQEAFD